MDRAQELGLDSGCRIWVARLDGAVASCDWALDAAERDRARRLHSPSRFVASRAALRTLLGDLLGLHPSDVPLRTGPNGKPELAEGPMFSLAHSGPWAAIAVTRTALVGIDLEAMPAHRDVTRLARRRFPEAEAEVIARLAPEPARASFVRCWTAKEAVVKALGLTLADGLRSAVVEPDPERPLRLIAAPGGPAANRWSLHELGLAGSRCHVCVAIAAPEVPLLAVESLPALRRPKRPLPGAMRPGPPTRSAA
jgi:4'-phosphopantetheinyl transferase